MSQTGGTQKRKPGHPWRTEEGAPGGGVRGHGMREGAGLPEAEAPMGPLPGVRWVQGLVQPPEE